MEKYYVIPERLKALRLERKLTREEVSDALDFSSSNILNRYESKAGNHRNPNKKNLQKLADFYNVSVDYLIGKTNYRTQKEEKRKKSLEALNKMKLPKAEQVKALSLDSALYDYASEKLGIDFEPGEETEANQWQHDSDFFMQHRYTELTGRNPDNNKPKRKRKTK